MRHLLLSCGFVVSLMGQTAHLFAESSESASKLAIETLRNEISAQFAGAHFAYTSFERSTRTGHQLWEEKVVETEQGILRRLIAVDGQQLSAEKQKSEEEHVAQQIRHPEKRRRSDMDRNADEKNRQRILDALSTAFIFTYGDEVGGCKGIHFTANPTFKPTSTEERVLRFLEGTAYVNESEKRFCAIDSTLTQKVEVGFGLLATMEKGGYMHIERVPTASGTWQNSKIRVHVVGRTFVFRNASQDIDQKRTNIREIPAHLTLTQAADSIKP